jgi:hypothetical protein
MCQNASLTTINKGLKAISNCSESIIFLFLGITTVNDHHEWNTAFSPSPSFSALCTEQLV